MSDSPDRSSLGRQFGALAGIRFALGFILTVVLVSAATQPQSPLNTDQRAVALALLIDRSGSMSAEVDGSGGRTRWDFAKQSALETATALMPGDELMIVAFGENPTVVLTRTEVTRITDLRLRIARLSPDEQRTEAGAALGLAAAQLAGSRAAVKHVVIVSDGEIHDADYTASMARRAAEQGITVSVVWLRSGTSRADPTARIARVGGGRSIPFDDITQVPRSVKSELNTICGTVGRSIPVNDIATAPSSAPHSDAASRPTTASSATTLTPAMENVIRNAQAKAGPFILPVTLTRKEFWNGRLSGAHDYIIYDAELDFGQARKQLRAVKGILSFTDLFGEVILLSPLTITDPPAKGGRHVVRGSRHVYNDNDTSLVWLRSTNTRDMHVMFHVKQVLFADGEIVDLTDR